MTTALAPALLSDPAITALRVVEDGTPLVDLTAFGLATVPTPPSPPAALHLMGPYAAELAPRPNVTPRTPTTQARPTHPAPRNTTPRNTTPTHTWARETLAERLVAADESLPSGIRLLVVEGLRPMGTQRAIHSAYRRALAEQWPGASDSEIDSLASRFVAPPAVAPHVSGAAVDLTLMGPDGPLDLGTPIDATPEESEGACYFAATSITAEARQHRELLAEALTEVGLVNYPTEWWHWSFGDRYWAHVTGSPFAIHGPIDDSPS